MTKTNPINKGKVIMAIVIVGGILLWLILTPILKSESQLNKNKININVSKKRPFLKGFPESYAEIKPEKKAEKKILPPPVIIDPDKEKIFKKKTEEIIIIPDKKVDIKPEKKELTEFEKAIIKGRKSSIDFSSFKAVKSNKKRNGSEKNTLKVSDAKYILSAGTIVSAISVTGINTDLPGHVIARVDRNIFDSVSGKQILLPQGSKIIGSYNSNVKLNEKRVQITWSSISLPNGSTLDLGKGQPGVGIQGVNGVSGKVKNHYFKNAISIFSIALLKSSANHVGNLNKGNLKGDVAEGIAGDVADAGADIFRKQVSFKPSITIPIGMPMRVLLTKDIIFNEAYNNDGKH